VWGREKVCTGFWWGGLKERDHWEDQGVVGRTVIKWTCERWDGGMDWIGLVRIGTGGTFL